MAATISLIIPTRNRPADLLETAEAILKQTRLPDELIVVDQSRAADSGRQLEQMIADHVGQAASLPYSRPDGVNLTGPGIRLIYIWNPSIMGLPMARNAGFAAASGDLICYLDDDITPAPSYLAEVERGFSEFPDWAALCGRFTDEQATSAIRSLCRTVFRRGLFRDDRVRLGKIIRPARVRLICGGAACFRREVLREFHFDEGMTGYALGEDLEFCIRAGGRFQFGGYPAAEWRHRRSLVGRPGPAQMRVMARASARYLWRTHRRHIGDDLSYLWLLAGFRLERLISTAISPGRHCPAPTEWPGFNQRESA